MKGPLCGGCYSKLIAEFYPGKHVRMEPQEGGSGSARPAGGRHGDKPDISRPASAPSREGKGNGGASGGPGGGSKGVDGGNGGASGGPGGGSKGVDGGNGGASGGPGDADSKGGSPPRP